MPILRGGCPIQFSVEVRTEGKWSVLDVCGDVDLATAPTLGKRIDELVAETRIYIVLNLEGASFMDSSGIGVLVGSMKRVREMEGELVLASPNPQVLRILELSGLPKVLPIFETLDSAIAVT